MKLFYAKDSEKQIGEGRMDFKKRFALPLPALEEELGERLSLIPETDQEMEEQARRYQLSLAKPPGSLGELENIAVRLAGMTGQLKSRIRKKRILVLCADNGVVEEGVSSAPQSVTAMQACNMTRSLTGMSCLAREFHCECRVVDVGIATPYHCPEIVDRRIKKGTANLAKEAAMTRRETLLAILTGMDLAEEAAKEGVDLLGVGEMGIGNTTTSSAVLVVLTGRSAREVTGRGGGLLEEAYLHKIRVIDEAVLFHRTDPADPVEVLSKVGGLDLAAMCGVFLGAARNRIPAVIDGFISIVAALLAKRLSDRASAYFFASHVSEEPGYLIAQKELSLSSFLQLQMRLGEGSGCVLAFEVIRAACTIMNEMATFEEANIQDDYLTEIRDEMKR